MVKKVAIGTFLEINGTFDNTSLETICARGSQGHSINPSLVDWTAAMLGKRWKLGWKDRTHGPASWGNVPRYSRRKYMPF